jgi:hypothetical protein
MIIEIFTVATVAQLSAVAVFLFIAYGAYVS